VLAVLEKNVADHHAAHDLAQEAWIRVFGALRAFRSDAAFRPWLFAIVLNLVRDDHRRRARVSHQLGALDAEAAPEAAAPRRDDPSHRAADRDALDQALASVPEPFRTALHLVDALGFSYDEAAQSLACSQGTVRSRVHRGRLAFRDSYQRLVAADSDTNTWASPALAARSGALRGKANSKEELA
jgi:RNA polymerase sigma-70 factor (ECF subfamily)